MNARTPIRDQVELWLMLVFLTPLGASLGLVLTTALAGSAGLATGDLTGLLLAGLLSGLLISLLANFGLRKFIQSAGAWTTGTTAGWALGLIVTAYSLEVMTGQRGWIVSGALGGLVYGLVQGFGLFQGFRERLQWVGLSALGWSAAYGLGYSLPSSRGLETISALHESVARGMLGWVILGIFALLMVILVFANVQRGDRGERVQWWP